MNQDQQRSVALLPFTTSAGRVMTAAAHYPSNPPLHDWCAWYDEEPRGECGYGLTREAAIKDLLADYPR